MIIKGDQFINSHYIRNAKIVKYEKPNDEISNLSNEFEFLLCCKFTKESSKIANGQ